MTAAKVLKHFKENEEKAIFEIDGKRIELPIIEGSEGEKAVDISKLRASTGVITLDHGFMNTGSCLSEITFLDGELGILKYRGYPIEELAENVTFEEVSYLLINNHLPNKDEIKNFIYKIQKNTSVPAPIIKMMKFFPKNAHPMGVLAALTNALSAFNPNLLDQDLDPDKKEQIATQLLGTLKILVANYYRVSHKKTIIESNPQLGFSHDFLNMMFHDKKRPIDKEVIKALDILLILHADHEQNCSTSTVRLVGSSKANLYASIAAGIGALWGPLHGGANQAVLEMLEEIKEAGGDYKKALQRAKDKNDTFRLMGFGHRVYKNFDPRAKIIKSACDSVLKKLGVSDPLLEIAKGLEEEALKDSYFVERKLYPNVDFYSGIIYRALGIPTNMFTVMFALGRLPGWIAQWKEMTESPATKIGRPRQIFVGETKKTLKRKN